MKKQYVIIISLLVILGIVLFIYFNANIEKNTINKGEEIMFNITIDNVTLNGVLYENATSKELLENLPLTLNMQELNGNEKYVYLDFSLPTDAQSVNTINAGDIMLYGDNCLVIFYETFTTNYQYTKIGYIEDVEQLKELLNANSVEVLITSTE